MNDQSTRVLLVDDDLTLLRSLVRVLEEYDFIIETASCAAEANAFLNHYEFDVVISDQNMPGMKGLDFLTNIKKERPEQIVMMLSGHMTGLRVALDWAKEIGVYDVFAKPCDGNVIAKSIQSAILSKRPRDFA